MDRGVHMDFKQVHERLNRRSYEEHYAELYDRRSKDEEAHELVQKRGLELATRYLEAAKGFQTIFDVTSHNSSSRRRCKITPDIVLGNITDPKLGPTKIVVRLSAQQYEKHGTLNTDSIFDALTDDDERYRLGTERFWTVGYAFGGGYAWLADTHYEWSCRKVDQAYGEMMPLIVAAQETQSMILEALGNPVLNPQFASSAR